MTDTTPSPLTRPSPKSWAKSIAIVASFLAGLAVYLRWPLHTLSVAAVAVILYATVSLAQAFEECEHD